VITKTSQNTSFRQRCRAAFCLVIVSALAGLPHAPASEGRLKPQAGPIRQSAQSAPATQTTAFDLILVDEHRPWLAALAAPVASRVSRGGRIPLLVAVSPPSAKPVTALLGRVKPQRSLLLAPDGDSPLVKAMAGLTPTLLATGFDPAQGSLRIAERFWGTSSEVVVASADDPGAIILASALAAQLAVPVLVYDPWEGEDALRQSLDRLKVERVLAATTGSGKPPWTQQLGRRVKTLAAEALQERLVTALAATNVQNVLLARVPDEDDNAGATAWLAPYVSLARRAPLVLCDSDSAAEAQERVSRLVARQRLRPRSVTILADYGSIGTNLVQITESGGANPAAEDSEVRYFVGTEPCVPTDFEQVAAFGVGRIPLESLEDASTLFVRGLVRQQLLGSAPPRMLMVSNPDIAQTPLPLCETVSRMTAEEFKNCGIHVDELYGKTANTPEGIAAAKAANLIIYEGHLNHEFLLHDPPTPEPAGADNPQAKPQKVFPQTRFDGPLDGLPVVVLQTCHSLEPESFARMHELGGVAMLGAATRVHSGSGSAFVKAACDGVLYRGDTLGEALRDARNYFLCLQELKSRRGHQEQAKTQRVALCFRLWGDPEVPVFAQPLAQPRRAAVSVAWDAADLLTIALPARRLDPVETALYLARMFPGSEAAGLVTRVGEKEVRPLLPVYFFRLPLPEAFATAGYDRLQAADDTSHRAVFRMDRLGQLLYVLYLPEKESPRQNFLLQFSRWRTLGRRNG